MLKTHNSSYENRAKARNVLDKNESIKTTVFEDAIYDSGFVTIPNGTFLATNFLFHKLKRNKV